MTRQQLIEEVSRNCSFTSRDGVEFIVKLFEQTIIDNLIKGHTIKLNGFLNIGTKTAKPRKFETKSKTVAYVKVSDALNKKIQEQQEVNFLDLFASYPLDIQKKYMKEAKRQLEDEKLKLGHNLSSITKND
jgi:nucleoid DNA-binding protein